MQDPHHVAFEQMKRTECSIELNVHELDIILKSLELVESIDEIQINRSSGSIDTLYDRLYDYYATLDTTNVELNYESYVDQSF